jgi:sulfur transfer complex TusBCD TusB component (DsrH family)
MGKTLNVVERAYHATLEEQDDVALWFALAMKVQGNLDQSVLLRGNAVNYLLRDQDASGLKIADIALDPPPRIAQDIGLLQEKGIAILAIEEDLAARAVPRDRLIPGVELVKKAELPALLATHDRVFYW